MDNLTPITREEILMNDEPLTPITREEKILAGEDLNPVTRREYFLKKYRHAGGEVMVEGLEVIANGTYTAPEGKAYSPVNVNVPLPDNAYLLKTASGSLVSFDDGADLPMPSFICNITAQQDLHGYDHPWVGGAGKNKLPMTVDGIKALNTNGSWSENVYTYSGGTFTILTDNDGNVTGIKINGTFSGQPQFYLGNGDFLSGNTYLLNGAVSNASNFRIAISTKGSDSGNGFTYTPTSDDLGRSVFIYCNNNPTADNLIFQPMIRLSTEADPTFAPYENICPISGHTGVNAWVRGKNLLQNTQTTQKINGITFTVNSDGSVTANGTATARAQFTIPIDTSTVYGDLYFVGCSGGSNSTYDVYMWDSTTSSRVKKWDGTTNSESSFNGTLQEIQIAQGNSVSMYLRIQSGQTVENVTFYPMICSSTETDSTYEPYNPQSQTIQVSWQTEAGEVYGGYVDLTSGELTVTDGYIASYNGETLPSTWISNRDTYAEGTSPTTGAEVVYKLANPQTYQLDGNQIKSLLGNNNAWCSTGNVNVDYFAKEVE